MFPWVVTWDDHEVDNNYAAMISEEDGLAPEIFLRRRAEAYQAYYEHMPLRPGSQPVGSRMQLYRQFSYGDLASFFVLDTRQYRTDQPCNDTAGPACVGVTGPGTGRSSACGRTDGSARGFTSRGHAGTSCPSRS